MNFTVRNKQNFLECLEWIARADDEYDVYTVTIHEGEPRNLEQNDKINATYRTIAKQLDWTFEEVRSHCKLYIGIRQVLATDTTYRERHKDFFELFKKLDDEKKLVAVRYLDVSSEMNKHQASEYLDLIHSEFSQQGVVFE